MLHRTKGSSCLWKNNTCSCSRQRWKGFQSVAIHREFHHREAASTCCHFAHAFSHFGVHRSPRDESMGKLLPRSIAHVNTRGSPKRKKSRQSKSSHWEPPPLHTHTHARIFRSDPVRLTGYEKHSLGSECIRCEMQLAVMFLRDRLHTLMRVNLTKYFVCVCVCMF